MKVSVVIPTYGRLEVLALGLDALASQTVEPRSFEVLVVDDGSPKPPQRLVASFADRLDVRLLHRPHRGLAAARNHGAAKARGEILLFLDDDVVPSPELLAAHLEVHDGARHVVALGSLPYPDDLPRTAFLYYLQRVEHYDLFRRYGSAERIPLPPLNGNSSLRRCHFERSGGYDLEFSGYGGEDTELGYRLRMMGLEFVYAARARGFHHHAKDFADYNRDMYASGVAMVRLVEKHPEVTSRVSLDLVLADSKRQPWRRRVKKRVFAILWRAPWLVGAAQRLIDVSGHFFFARHLLFPLFLLVGHFHYGRGMREGLARTARSERSGSPPDPIGREPG